MNPVIISTMTTILKETIKTTLNRVLADLSQFTIIQKFVDLQNSIDLQKQQKAQNQ